jgi:hypothetical protein
MDFSQVPVEEPEFAQGGEIPELDNLVVASRRQSSAIWRETQTQDRAVMCRQPLGESPRRKIPEADLALPSPGG